MKAILATIVIAAVTFSGCADNAGKSKDVTANSDTSQTGNQPANEQVAAASSNEVVAHYLHLKNALANDNAKEAATAGNAVTEAIQQIGAASLTTEQRKVYDEVKEDIKEHGQHISNNAGKIEHQREHFEMLSKDMYDLVKVLKTSQTLYHDHCPMYNGNKGANWLSEVKEIKNPYLGKSMLTCGSVKEEIK